MKIKQELGGLLASTAIGIGAIVGFSGCKSEFPKNKTYRITAEEYTQSTEKRLEHYKQIQTGLCKYISHGPLWEKRL